MEPTQLRQLIRDTLASNDLPAFMGKADDNAEALLCMIAAHETNCGYYLRQIKGSALGIFQMEPATHEDVLRYLKAKANTDYGWLWLHDRLQRGGFSDERLVYDLRYAIIFARIYLWRISEAIPDAADVNGLAEYAKTYWNTEAGKATPKLYADAYKKYFAPSTPKAKSSNAKAKTQKTTRSKTSAKSG